MAEPIEHVLRNLEVDDRCRFRFLGQGEEHTVNGVVTDRVAVSDGYVVAIQPEHSVDILGDESVILVSTVDSSPSVDAVHVEDGDVESMTSLGFVVSFGRRSEDAVGLDAVSSLDADALRQLE